MTLKKRKNPFIEDILCEIFSFIKPNTKFKLNCRLVCKQWNTIIMNSSNIWQNDEVYIDYRKLQKIPVQMKHVLTRIECSVEITDSALKQISHFTKLQRLNLWECKLITDDGIKHLMILTSLQQLNLRYTRITDNGLKYLKTLTSLQQLDLNLCEKITDHGLHHLMNLRKLQQLDLSW